MTLTKDIVKEFKSLPLKGRNMLTNKMNILENISLASYTTFKIGSSARYFISVSSEDELKKAAEWTRQNKLPIFILGGGSNILISDKGFRPCFQAYQY